jgi:hypothetical protein
MTIKEHLTAFHEKSAAHHVAMAKTHRAIAKHFSKSEMAEGSEDLASSHEELAGHHADQAAYHVQCCKDLSASMKAAGMSDDDAIRPDGISAIIPDVPQSVRAVPRHGQRQIIEKTEVPEELEKLVSFD